LDRYQVPPEVGKVSQQNASFIRPVKERKDGIEAMFSKQKSKSNPFTEPQASSTDMPEPGASPRKRKAEEITSTSPTSPKEFEETAYAVFSPNKKSSERTSKAQSSTLEQEKGVISVTDSTLPTSPRSKAKVKTEASKSPMVCHL
jgi:hypothetical protein